MWLVRDFSLELIAGGREITADEYLERALLPVQGDDEDIQSKNTIRQTIIQAFRDRFVEFGFGNPTLLNPSLI